MKKKPQEVLLSRLLITTVLVYVFFIGKSLPLPSVDHLAIEEYFREKNQYTTLNNISGGSVEKLGLFTLNIFPVLNASIILQFLIPIIPYFERLQKEEGELGQKELNKIRKVIVLILSIIQAIGLVNTFSIFIQNNILVVFYLTTGSMIIAWISDVLTDKGIATGPSLLLFINIIENPKLFSNLQKKFWVISQYDRGFNFITFIFIALFVVLMLDAKTEIPIVTIRQMQSEDNFFTQKKNASIPLKLNQGGILPLALGTAFSLLPGILFGQQPFLTYISPIITYTMVIVVNYFYTIFLWDPKKISEDLRKVSATIPGIRPGVSTKIYLTKLVTRYSILGGVLLSLLSVVPLLFRFLGNPNFFIFDYINISSLVIVLGVIVEVFKNIKSLLSSVSYS